MWDERFSAERVNATWDALHESFGGVSAMLSIAGSLYRLLHNSCEVHYRIIQSAVSSSQEIREAAKSCVNIYSKSESFTKQLRLTLNTDYVPTEIE